MKNIIAIVFAISISASIVFAQQHRIFLTTSDIERVGVTSSEVGKNLDKHCPSVVLTIDKSKADYLLEAIYNGDGPARHPYKFTLFNPSGDRIFSTETASLGGAMKGVCRFISKQKQID